MFKYVLLFALIAVAVADEEDAHAEIKLLESDINHDGFRYSFETSNGIYAKQAGNEKGVHGEFEWTDKKGEHVKVSYVADEHGYQPKSDWLPTPPPIPEAILKSLQWIAAHPDAEEEHH